MACETFVAKTFTRKTAETIRSARGILEEYRVQGYDLSLRQLYYQFVSRDMLPNTQRDYKNLGSVINDARLAGEIDWEMIKDRGRETVENAHWRTPAEFLDDAMPQFQIDKWQRQPRHVEVMVEKQALEGVLEPVCRDLDVPFSANKGYSSASHLYDASRRMLPALEHGRAVYVLYLGDHDPSGIDMTRDVEERLQLLLGFPVPESFTVRRVALNMEQIRRYNPPENPAKLTDSRAEKYIERYGTSSWELDALNPTILAAVVTDHVRALRDDTLWQEAIAEESAMKSDLLTYASERT